MDNDEDATPGGDRYNVVAPGAQGLQVGTGNVQYVFVYQNRLTWSDKVAPPPLMNMSGEVDSPYRGLAAFEEVDAPFFFGRDKAIAHMLERMSRMPDHSGILVVSGVSGAGKSSLLRAGVLPRIRGMGLEGAREAADWPCVVFTPTGSPLDKLAVGVALRAGVDAGAVRRALDDDPAGFALTASQAAASYGDGARLLLIVDQFEQVFTQCDEWQRRAFVTALHAATMQAKVPRALAVLLVRADFEARLADMPELEEAVQDRYLVTSMTRRQLQLAITEPAKKARAQVEPELVEELLRNADSHVVQPAGPLSTAVSGAGVLPLFSHALDQAWRGRADEEALTLADYERTGGIEGAVEASAQRAYDGLSLSQQATARRIFMRLTATSSDGMDTAARVTRSALTAGMSAGEEADTERVLEAFTGERLIMLAADTVEISHEVLLTAWPLLRDTWLAETHADRIVRTRLAASAGEWAEHGKDISYLYGGSLLETAGAAAHRVTSDPARHAPLNEVERAFLEASSAAQDRRTRARRRRNTLLMALCAGLAAASMAAVIANFNATSQHTMALSRQFGAQSEAAADGDPIASARLAAAAWHTGDTSEARHSLLAVLRSPYRSSLTAHTGPIYGVAFNKDGVLAAAGADGTVRLWDAAHHRLLGTLVGHQGIVFRVAFSSDGGTLASTGRDGTVRLWDVASRTQIGKPLTGHEETVYGVAFSPDGETLATGGYDRTVRLWSVNSHRLFHTLKGHTGTVVGVAFSPDGKTLASTSNDGTVRLWTTSTGWPLRTLRGHKGAVNPVAFNRDGTLLTGGWDHLARAWDVRTGEQLGVPFTAHTNTVYGLEPSPDGTLLATAGIDNTVWIWDMRTHRPLRALPGHKGPVYGVAFSPDGAILATTGDDATVRLWDMTIDRPIRTLTGHSGVVSSVAFRKDSTMMASGSDDDTVRVWDTATYRQLDAITDHAADVRGVVFAPHDGRIMATGSWDRTVRLWDAATRRPLGPPLSGHTGKINSVALSSDGTVLASASDDKTVRLWDVQTGRTLAVLEGHTAEVKQVAFSPDGKTLVSGSWDWTVRLWDVATHRQVGDALTDHHGYVNSVAFSPDGTLLASASDDQTVRLWDTATRRALGAPLAGHSGPVTQVAFSADGRLLASASQDTTLRLWDVGTRRAIGQPLRGHTDVVYTVAFSSDGKTLASGSKDQTVRLWNVALPEDDHILASVCPIADGSLTPEQWESYAPEEDYRQACPPRPIRSP
ncbi:WD40 repeat domain-containing protein [Nonomuraea sp. NEAU-A123]|uniref:nSTAND1 domain-containing NTPase n=1 Tax=Nonomuraea sp. NEAU-A123 TaxID=2839649 RepID=UPI001BE403F3|nr:WD40 repeat domain-containing protein [Nonomuraea sp. NEAU-A123]MBT2230050.1 hypothetical protein [Nonomuraea sp. NEAU-A123]MBT2230680.1 hypothetical protein [Nonomuraea sp. NEAU-A123]